MFTTSLTALAVAGLLASNTTVAGTTWQTDYAEALKVANSTRKPMAVFIAAGGQDRLIEGGVALDAEAIKVLRDKFVPLHVDTNTEAGKRLASSFEMKVGLVISDASGGVQALRHDGTVSSDTLKIYLSKFDGHETVSTTLSTTTPATTAGVAPTMTLQFVAGTCANGNCGRMQYVQSSAAAPVESAPAAVAVPYNNSAYYQARPVMTSGSTCRNGNCGRR